MESVAGLSKHTDHWESRRYEGIARTEGAWDATKNPAGVLRVIAACEQTPAGFPPGTVAGLTGSVCRQDRTGYTPNQAVNKTRPRAVRAVTILYSWL